MLCMLHVFKVSWKINTKGLEWLMNCGLCKGVWQGFSKKNCSWLHIFTNCCTVWTRSPVWHAHRHVCMISHGFWSGLVLWMSCLRVRFTKSQLLHIISGSCTTSEVLNVNWTCIQNLALVMIFSSGCFNELYTVKLDAINWIKHSWTHLPAVSSWWNLRINELWIVWGCLKHTCTIILDHYRILAHIRTERFQWD